MENLSVGWMLSEKGRKLLLVNNYKFSKANETKCGKIRWKCNNRKCLARIYTSATDEKILEVKEEHNHEADATIPRQILSNSLKRKACEDISERPAKIINLELGRNSSNEEILSRDVDNIRRNMYNARRKIISTLPKSCEDVLECVRNLELKTMKEENFVIDISDSEKIIIFSCFTNLHFLCSVEKIFMDGTFSCCTKFFYQMFTVHGFKNGHYVPLVFGLLPKKTEHIYTVFFQNVIKKCAELGLTLNPTEIVIDFEMGIHKSSTSVWPMAKIVGCRFHLCQSWFRKIQELGLVTEYRNHNSIVGNYLKLYFGLQFLDASEVLSMFNTELYYLIPANVQSIHMFRNYLMDNYIGDNSRFPPKIWASNSNFIYRTTNSCESFHSRFNKSFYNSHPNIFQFTNVLLSFQNDIYVKIRTANSYTKKMRKETCNKLTYVNNQITLYKEQQISRYSFVKSVSYKYLPN